MTSVNKKLRIAFIGCVESSFRALNTLINMNCVEVCAVVTRQDSKVNSDFVDLSSLCEEEDIPYYFENPQEREGTYRFLKGFELDVIYCFGWSYLLKKETLELTEHGVIGFHPAKLPANRGRHPLIWALSLGLEVTASTFFKMDEGADSGPILSQRTINIEKCDNATSLYNKVLAVADDQIVEFTQELHNGTARFYEQNHEKANYWRKRGRKDGLIDWRMTANAVHNLIRSLASPYPGAEFAVNEKLFTVMDSTPVFDSYPENIEPGKVLSIKENGLLVKCAGRGAIWLHELDPNALDEIGEYL